MGDRGNIAIQYENGQRIYFYTHWKGSQTREIVKKALARKERWNDDAYLARIIFCELIDGDTDGETGFGISPNECDPENPTIVVDTVEKKVWVDDCVSYTFQKFIGEIDNSKKTRAIDL